MRRILGTAVSLLALSGLLVAQGHSNLLEKKVSDQMILVSDVKFGTELLRAGEYRVTCDAKTVTFTLASDTKQVVRMPCKGKELAKPVETTVVFTDLNRDGVRYVQKLLLRGSNVEHVFDRLGATAVRAGERKLASSPASALNVDSFE